MDVQGKLENEGHLISVKFTLAGDVLVELSDLRLSLVHLHLSIIQLLHLVGEYFFKVEVLVFQALDLLVLWFKVSPHFVSAVSQYLLGLIQILDLEAILVKVSFPCSKFGVNFVVLNAQRLYLLLQVSHLNFNVFSFYPSKLPLFLSEFFLLVSFILEFNLFRLVLLSVYPKNLFLGLVDVVLVFHVGDQVLVLLILTVELIFIIVFKTVSGLV
jgi:hypothetical protein